MLNEATLHFVSRHTHDDVRVLALRGCKEPGVDLTLALQQIQGRQTARRKLPAWAATDGIVYPPHLNMEQCSSEFTARYKARLARGLLSDAQGARCSTGTQGADCRPDGRSGRLVDLTGGFGVDFAFMSEAFAEAVYVERDASLCEIAAHNFKVLGLDSVATLCADADAFFDSAHAASLCTGTASGPLLVFLDPARRDNHGGRTYALSDCTPNVVTMMPALAARADSVMLKLSPMLDWRKAMADLAPHCVSQVHIVAVDNECKELLLLLTRSADKLTLTCADINSRDGSCSRYSPRLDGGAAAGTGPTDSCASPAYLYEPNAAVMKAGCFGSLSADFGVVPLAANSHLFTASRHVAAFPGRCFRIETTCSMNKRELRTAIAQLRQANIAVRNFPLTAEQLRARLKLADGGDDYIFATTLKDNSHRLFLCKACR